MTYDISKEQGHCGSCAHFESNEDRTAGFCVRFPPVVIMDGEGLCTVFPIVEASERCGEHKAGQ